MRIAIKNLPSRHCLATLARDTSPKQGEALFRLRFLRFTHFVRFGRKERSDGIAIVTVRSIASMTIIIKNN